MEEITFRSDGYKLAGHLLTPQDGHGHDAFLFIQGWTGNQNIHAAKALSERGFVSMTYDMRGNKTSEGNLDTFSRNDFLRDAEVAYDHLRQRVGEKSLISVVGSSFGSYTAAILSARRPVHSLSLRVPADYQDEGSDAPHAAQMNPAMRQWRTKQRGYTETEALRSIHDFNGRVQIIEAGADDIVDSQTPRNYAAAVANQALLTYEIMPDAPHGLDSDQLRNDYTARLVEWADR